MLEKFQIKQSLSQAELNIFLASQPHSSFLQTFEWAEFQKSLGQKVFYFGITDKDEIIATVALIKKTLPAGQSYFYSPKGPVVNDKCLMSNDKLILEKIVKEVKKMAKQENVIFWRFEPNTKYQILNTRYKIQKTLDIQPSRTLILDLAKSEDALLANMRQKTRYNIRLAGKKGVKIKKGSIADFEQFWELMQGTGKRDNFRLHGKEYYKKMLESLAQDKNKNKQNQLFINLFFARYNQKPIAASLVAFFGDTATYLHGASSDANRNVMAPYLLQWEAIKQAKKMGCEHYDFYGIDEAKWPGVTRFKKGFGGGELEYPGTFDFVFSRSKYVLYNFLRKAKRTL